MAVAGALIGNAIGAFGRKPNIPELGEIDPSKVQAETIAQNVASLPGAEQLAAGVNKFNVQQRLGTLTQAMQAAGMGGGLGQIGGNIMAQLRGEINPDVAAQIQRNSAGQSLAGGFGGGSMLGRNLTARDFGMTSMGLQQQGLANYQGMANMLTPQAYDVSSMFYSPQQRLEFAFQDRAAHFQRNLLYEQIAAAPNPGTAALGKEIDRFWNTAASVGMSYAGGGGMGGGMAGG